jgi:hypothetical protein
MAGTHLSKSLITRFWPVALRTSTTQSRVVTVPQTRPHGSHEHAYGARNSAERSRVVRSRYALTEPATVEEDTPSGVA